MLKVSGMSSTLTIRNLEEPVKRMLRIQAASHGRSMEAEAREILSRSVKGLDESSPAPLQPKGIEAESKLKQATQPTLPPGKFDHLIGIWQGRGTTEQLMRATRGEH